MKRTHVLVVAAAALVVGGLAGAQLTSGAGESEPSAFVSMTPCRLLDTRPAFKIGPHATLGAGTTRVATVWGNNGQCTIPSSATAISMNVTAVEGTAGSFLTVWPSDAASRPGTSNLNWVPGAPPTPNKVDVALSSNGKVSIFNRFGTVNVIADIVGYYETVVAATGTVSAVEIVTATIDIEPNAVPPGANGQGIAQCPADTVAIAGGVENPTQVALNTRSSRPNPDGAANPTGWFGDVRSAQAGAADFESTVYAVCITLNP